MKQQLELFVDLEISLPPTHEGSTLAEAQQVVLNNVHDGVNCPCCGQMSRIYKRKFNANMAVFLISLVQISRSLGLDWVHYSKCLFRGRDYPYVATWGLAYCAKNDDTTKRASGFWRPTELGLQFVAGNVSIAKHVAMFDNSLCGYSREAVSIRKALGQKFDYQELMGRW